MRNWAAGIGVLLVAGLVWASAAGCNKTKAEQGAALLLEMVDVNQGAVEDIIDLVDDNYDLCVKGLREVTDLQKSTRATMQTLVNQFHGESMAVIQHAITAKLFVRSLLLIFAIAIISVFISHRIAGPIYKFERILEAMAAGEKVREITLRKHDEFYRLAQAINSLIRARK